MALADASLERAGNDPSAGGDGNPRRAPAYRRKRMKSTTAAVAAALLSMAAAPIIAAPTPGEAVQRAEIHVGIDEGDLRGADHRALQAAVDYVAGLGGGTVWIGPGRYVM